MAAADVTCGLAEVLVFIGALVAGPTARAGATQRSSVGET